MDIVEIIDTLDNNTVEKRTKALLKELYIFRKALLGLNVHVEQLLSVDLHELAVYDDRDFTGGYSFIHPVERHEGHYSISLSIVSNNRFTILGHEYGHHLYHLYTINYPKFFEVVHNIVVNSDMLVPLYRSKNINQKEKEYMSTPEEVYARIHESLMVIHRKGKLKPDRHFSYEVCMNFLSLINRELQGLGY